MRSDFETTAAKLQHSSGQHHHHPIQRSKLVAAVAQRFLRHYGNEKAFIGYEHDLRALSLVVRSHLYERNLLDENIGQQEFIDLVTKKIGDLSPGLQVTVTITSSSVRIMCTI